MLVKPYFVELAIYSKEGILESKKKVPFRSFVRQFPEIRRIRYAGVAGSVRDVTNTLISHDTGWTEGLNSPAATAAYGVGVGTGTNPVTISDYNLQTPIAHGNGAGQLYHQATVVSAVTVSGSDAYFTIQRTFNNNSGGTITVQEAGIISMDLTYYFLQARDITGAIDVLNTKSLVVTYTFKVTA